MFTSNRGQDGIASFAVDAGSGQLRSLGWIDAPGREPRFMAFHGDHLYVASERDDVVGRFAFDGPALEPLQRVVSSLSPVCIAFA